MSKLQSQLMRRRWKNRDYRRVVRERIREGVRRSLVPKVKLSKPKLDTPNLRRSLPPQVTAFLNNRADECCEITSCEPLRVDRTKVWRIALIDGSDDSLKARYCPLVREHGLHLYRIYSRPLAAIGGVAVVLFVGVPKEHMNV